jgi:predicted RNA-binding Zn-ribbon protein involved in translation (DUF1610 family)
MDLEIPYVCNECGFCNFYVWGTIMNEIMNVEWRCMRCGNKIISYDHEKIARVDSPLIHVAHSRKRNKLIDIFDR